MREANWDEIFQRREAWTPPADERLKDVIPWEEWLTLLITGVLFMAVVHSIDSAHWVDNMPSLYPVGLSALLVGYGLSKVRLPGLLLQPLGLLAGATLVFLQLMAILPGPSLYVRTDALLDRMYVWWSAATQGGISSDTLPFIVLTLTLVWLGTYISAWAVFRLQNAWLGLVPGGIALMWNISFIPGQFSYSFVVFVFAAVLLIMRMHVSHREKEWDRAGVTYPEFISLSVLNATFWVTVGLLVAVWLVPLAQRSDSANERWQHLTSPLTDRLTPLARVFISVNAKKPIAVHNLKDALALQGAIRLNGDQAVEVNVKLTPEMAAYLRAQSFDEYTSSGWKVNVTGDVPFAPGEFSEPPPPADSDVRKSVTVNVTVEGGNNGVLYSLGQPIRSDQRAEAKTVANGNDVVTLKPRDHLSDGDTYSVTGSVSVASVDRLRAAGSRYPASIAAQYLQLPDNLPPRVAGKAAEVTQGAETPYDKAAAIEQYLRSFPVDFDVPKTPAGRDTIDFFLFDAQRGYFDYHASAMAVMLRSLGIPARVAAGYVIDPLQAQGDDGSTYQLTEKNAWAWPEVYFPSIGWVEFNPTPSQPLIRRPGSPQASANGGGGTRGTLDPVDLGALANDPGLGGAAVTPADPALQAPGGGGGGRAWPAWLPLAIFGGVLLAGAGGARIAWERGLAGEPRPAQLWRKTQRLARWSRAGGPPSETPREFAQRLAREVPGAGEAVVLASGYERTAFGRKALGEDEQARMEMAWVRVRNSLLRRFLRR